MTGLLACLSLLEASGPFIKAYGGAGDDVSNMIIPGPNNTLILVGYTESFGVGNQDILVVKMDYDGNIIWARTLGGPGNECANSVFQASDGSILIGGWTNSSGFGPGGSDLLVAKLDGDGNLLWGKTFGGTISDSVCYVTEASDGGILALGMTMSYGIDNNYDLLVLRLDPASGDPIWGKKFGEAWHDYCAAITSTPDTGCVIAGNFITSPGESPLSVLKLDRLGNVQWRTNLDDILWAYGMIRTPDDELILAGYTDAFGQGERDFVAVKLRGSGTFLWAKAIGGIDYDYPFSVSESFDGGYVITGLTWSYGSFSQGLTLRLNDQGDFSWGKIFGGDVFDHGVSVTRTSSGMYAISGQSLSYGAGGTDFLLVLLDNQGNNPGCVEDCAPVIVDATPNITTSPYAGVDCLPVTMEPPLIAGTPDVIITKVCEASYGNTEKEGNQGVVYFPVRGGVVFVSAEATGIEIYSPDGRVAYSGRLKKGWNRINLKQGIHLVVVGHENIKAISVK